MLRPWGGNCNPSLNTNIVHAFKLVSWVLICFEIMYVTCERLQSSPSIWLGECCVDMFMPQWSFKKLYVIAVNLVVIRKIYVYIVDDICHWEMNSCFFEDGYWNPTCQSSSISHLSMWMVLGKRKIEIGSNTYECLSMLLYYGLG